MLKSGKLDKGLDLPKINLDDDRFMLCSSEAMTKDMASILDNLGFLKAKKRTQGHYVIENAFVEK